MHICFIDFDSISYSSKVDVLLLLSVEIRVDASNKWK